VATVRPRGPLNPKPANYTTSAISAESDGSLFWKLSEGRGAMLAFKAAILKSNAGNSSPISEPCKARNNTISIRPKRDSIR